MRPLTIAAFALTVLLAAGAYAQQAPAPAPRSSAPPAGAAQGRPATPTTAMPAAALPATAGAGSAASAAAGAAPTVTAGDIRRGRQLVYTCQGCHGVTGYRNAYPNYHVPRIAGQNQQYLVSALMGYRQGTRKHPTMQAQAQSLSEQDIADIAAYLASLK